MYLDLSDYMNKQCPINEGCLRKNRTGFAEWWSEGLQRIAAKEPISADLRKNFSCVVCGKLKLINYLICPDVSFNYFLRLVSSISVVTAFQCLYNEYGDQELKEFQKKFQPAKTCIDYLTLNSYIDIKYVCSREEFYDIIHCLKVVNFIRWSKKPDQEACFRSIIQTDEQLMRLQNTYIYNFIASSGKDPVQIEILDDSIIQDKDQILVNDMEVMVFQILHACRIDVRHKEAIFREFLCTDFEQLPVVINEINLIILIDQQLKCFWI